MIKIRIGSLAGIAVLFLLAMIATFERPPVTVVQGGYRGTGMQQVLNPRTVAEQLAVNQLPAHSPLTDAGPPAGTVYKNVQVLKNVSVGAFTGLMLAMTNWVSPKEGCAYCHDTANFAADTKYTKIVARRMLQMTQTINATWKTHVGDVGVTCWTCHRGQNVPSYVWFTPAPAHAGGITEASTGKNLPAPVAGYASLPYDPIGPLLAADNPISVQATQALAGSDRYSIKQTEWTYALMMHISTSLGVNCTFCHETRSFGDWSQSTPQRVTAWYGIRMVRDLNINYLLPLAHVFPADQHGPTGDGPKLDCATCHQGVYKPMFGATMTSDYPPLMHPTDK